MKTHPSPTRGFSLVEVVLALAIAAFSLITIMALLPAGLGADKASIEQTEAVNFATSIVADLRQTPTAAQVSASNSTLTYNSPRYGINVAQSTTTTLYLDAGGNSSTAVVTGSRYKVAVTLNPPSSGHTATFGTIVVSWPPAAIIPSNTVSTFIALDRN